MSERVREQKSGLAAVIGVAALVALAVLVAIVWLRARSGENDYQSSPIALSDLDSGSRVVVEAGDEFEIGLIGEQENPDLAWIVAEMDESVIELTSSRHEPEGTALEESDDGEPAYYLPLTGFHFTGKALGETELLLELWVENELLRSFEATVWVVEDACNYFESQQSSTKVPHRCG